MMSEALRRAREYERANGPLVPETERPVFHVTADIGWMNDPNGFSLYRGEYHLFYQYHPFSIRWGPMHWGHMKSRDFLHWERLPAAMAPDQPYDRDGVWSGSALELPDGRQLLLYTGRRIEEENGTKTVYQTQCLATGDGVDFEKWAGNPVLTAKDLPEGCSPSDFRDPKLWREPDGTYHAVTVTRTEDGSGAALLYGSPDGFQWTFETMLDRSRNEYGVMWECPDFFPLDGKQALIVSPMQLKPVELRFPEGFGAVVFLGRYDGESRTFTRESAQCLDFGPDFYAAQTLETPDGRRVMIAWMQNWAGAWNQPEGVHCFGELTAFRELSVRDGVLVQTPIRELEQCRTEPIFYRNVRVSGELELEGIRGRVLDMTLTVRPEKENGFRWFAVHVADDGEHRTTVRFEPEASVVRVDRSRCAAPWDVIQTREFAVRQQGGKITLRLLMDRHSLELFVNDGEQASTLLLYTPESADAIRFETDGGTALLDVEKYAMEMP